MAQPVRLEQDILHCTIISFQNVKDRI